MSYEEKLTAAKAVVDEHNSHLPPESEKLNWDQIRKSLVTMGGTTEASLGDVTWEDLQQCGLPRILARTIANSIFRVQSSQIPKPLSDKKVGILSIEQLLESYDPTGFSAPAITRRLRELVGDKPCIVLSAADQNRADVQLSAPIIRDILDGMPPPETVIQGGNVVRPLAVGERPDSYVNENPLFPGRPLRGGEICTVTERSFARVPHKARQVLYLAITKTNELSVKTLDDAHRVFDYLDGLGPTDADVESSVSLRYRKAAMLLNESKESGEPTLRIKKTALSKPPSRDGGKPNDPFYGKHVRT